MISLRSSIKISARQLKLVSHIFYERLEGPDDALVAAVLLTCYCWCQTSVVVEVASILLDVNSSRLYAGALEQADT